MSLHTVLQYPLKIIGLQEVSLPKGAKILSVPPKIESMGELCVWALVDLHADAESRTLLVCGTGTALPDQYDLVFIGTVAIKGYEIICHVFEEVPS